MHHFELSLGLGVQVSWKKHATLWNTILVSTISELLQFFILIPLFLKCLSKFWFLNCSCYWWLQMAPTLNSVMLNLMFDVKITLYFQFLNTCWSQTDPPDRGIVLKQLVCMNPGSSRSRAALQGQVSPEPMRQEGQRSVVHEKTRSRDGEQCSQWPQLSVLIGQDHW